MTQTLRIDGWHPPQVANGPQTNRWRRADERRAAKWLVAIEISAANWQPVETPVCLTVTFVYPRRVRVDEDNLVARCKPICDALVACGIVRDDSMDLLRLRVERTVEPNAKALILELEERML